MYKIIFIDIDGTLRNKNKEITQRTKKAIKNVVDKGIIVVLASGRPRKYTQNVNKEAGASQYIISSNGGNVYDCKERKNLYTNVMDKQAILEIYKLANKENIRLMMNVGEGRVVTKLKYIDNSERELKEDINKFVQENDVCQCVISDSDYEKVKQLRDKVAKLKNVEIKYQTKTLLDETLPIAEATTFDVANTNTSKGNAAKRLCNILNIDLKDAIAIGDDENDIKMLQAVGLSIAMENATDKVKKYADKVIKSNEEDGVAIFLEQFFNI